jgi:15-cis-phytoene synthase/lycopene beta-cyclase
VTSHVKYTIPPAVLLTLLYRPLFSKLDAYRVGFLVFVCRPALTWLFPR